MKDKEPKYFSINTNHVIYLNDLCKVVNDWATKKGWNEDVESQMTARQIVSHKAEQIALMHSELSECLEFLRKKPTEECPHCNAESSYLGLELDSGYIWKCKSCKKEHVGKPPKPAMDDHVPELTGEAAEMADVLIRIFHYCGKRNIDLGKAVQLKHKYNTSRPFRHGKNC